MTRFEYLQSLDSTVAFHYNQERGIMFVKGEELGEFRPGSSEVEAVDNAIAEMLMMVRTAGGLLTITFEGKEHEITADSLRGISPVPK